MGFLWVSCSQVVFPGGSLSPTARWSSVVISWSYPRFGRGRGWVLLPTSISFEFNYIFNTDFVMFLEAAEFWGMRFDLFFFWLRFSQVSLDILLPLAYHSIALLARTRRTSPPSSLQTVAASSLATMMSGTCVLATM